MGFEEPLLQLRVRINDNPGRLWVFPDRIEYDAKGATSKGKVALGVMTGGVSMLATGVRGRGDRTVISLREVNSISRKRESMNRDIVTVLTAGNSFAISCTKSEAEKLQAILQNAMNSLHAASHSAPAVVAVGTTGQQEKTAIEKVHELTELYQAGILTAEEYSAAKAKALGL